MNERIVISCVVGLLVAAGASAVAYGASEDLDECREDVACTEDSEMYAKAFAKMNDASGFALLVGIPSAVFLVVGLLIPAHAKGAAPSPTPHHNAQEALVRTCSACRAPLPADAKHCPQCGQQQNAKCTRCGKMQMAGDTYCAECGVRLAP